MMTDIEQRVVNDTIDGIDAEWLEVFREAEERGREQSDMTIDFHWSSRREGWKPYYAKMGEVYDVALAALKYAYDRGIQRVLLIHGYSTSGPFKMTSRSVIRGLMRSKEATPYIRRSDCIQTEGAFGVAIRSKPKT